MNNSRLTPKDRNAIKGAIRRAFARSELHRRVKAASEVVHTDSSRPRVKTWSKCTKCKTIDAKSYMVVDHIQPVIEVHTTLEDISWDELVNRIWCEENNLQILCIPCHNLKSKDEMKQRRLYKKERKK